MMGGTASNCIDLAAANGLGLQQATTTNANFLNASQAQVPNYRLELNEKNYFALEYVDAGYAEDLI